MLNFVELRGWQMRNEKRASTCGYRRHRRREELPVVSVRLTKNIRNSKIVARRFEVLHRRNYIGGVPEAPDLRMTVQPSMRTGWT